MELNLRDLARQLRDRRETLEVKQMIQLVNLRLEKTKNELVTAPADTFPQMQGEAHAYKKLLNDLTRSDDLPGIKKG